MPATIHTEALLVRSVDYGEFDRIVTLITRELGKVGAIARGARRSRRRFAGALEPFQVIRASLTPRSRSELSLLGEAEVVRPLPAIPADPAKYAFASFAVELVRELTPAEERDARPFDLLAGFLATLDSSAADPALLVRAILGALSLAGFEPALSACAACGRPAPRGSAARFDPSRGIVCTRCGGGPLLLRGSAREALVAIAAGEATPGSTHGPEIGEAVTLLRTFAEGHLGRALKSAPLAESFLAHEAEPGRS